MRLFWRETIKTTVEGDTTYFDRAIHCRSGDVTVTEWPGGSAYVVRRRWVWLETIARRLGL